MAAQGYGVTDVGQQREQNEDAFLVDNDLGLYVISDGMGGHAAGEIASATAVQVLTDAVREKADLVADVRDGKADALVLGPIMEAAVQKATGDIYRMASSSPDRSGMGCTLTALILVGEKAVIAHVGDSRLYLVRGNTAHQLSQDHTLAQELVRAGSIDAEHVKKHPYAHVLTRAVGVQEGVQADSLIFDAHPGDRFVICSDGLGDYLDTPDQLLPLMDAGPIGELPARLCAFANESGGKDNVTVICVEVEGSGDDEQPGTAHAFFSAIGMVPMFARLSLSQRLHVYNACTFMAYEAGDVVIGTDEPTDALMVVASGAIQMAGSDLVLERGDAIGWNAVVHPTTPSALFVADADSTVLWLTRMNLRKLARRRPRLGARLFQRIATLIASEGDGLL